MAHGSTQGIGTLVFGRYHSPLRWPVMLMLLVSAVAHIPVVAPELGETVYVGVLFLVLIVADCVLIAALLVRDAAGVWLLTAVTTGLALLAYVFSRTTGLPGLSNYTGEWVSTPGLAALISEGVGCALAIAALVLGPQGARVSHNAVT